MKISPYNIISLTLHTGCAAANAYLAPGTFALSFAVGIIFGLGSGIKSRLDLIRIELNEKAIEKLKQAGEPLQIKPLQNKASIFFNEYSDKVPSIVKPIFNGIFYFSGYKSLYETACQVTGGFEEQRKAILQKLNPIPGIILNTLSVGSLAANLGYLPYTISLISGYPAGYSTGLFLSSLKMSG